MWSVRKFETASPVDLGAGQATSHEVGVGALDVAAWVGSGVLCWSASLAWQRFIPQSNIVYVDLYWGQAVSLV